MTGFYENERKNLRFNNQQNWEILNSSFVLNFHGLLYNLSQQCQSSNQDILSKIMIIQK